MRGVTTVFGGGPFKVRCLISERGPQHGIVFNRTLSFGPSFRCSRMIACACKSHPRRLLLPFALLGAIPLPRPTEDK